MGLYAQLKKDHRELESIFKMLVQAPEQDVERREEIFSRLKDELMAHSAAESAVFYSFLKGRSKTKGAAEESSEKHRAMDALLEELTVLKKDDPEWLPKLKVLETNFIFHMREEEKYMFRQARQVIGPEQEKEMELQLLEARNSFLQNRRTFLSPNTHFAA